MRWDIGTEGVLAVIAVSEEDETWIAVPEEDETWIAAQQKCTRVFAPIAAKNVKSHFNLRKDDQSTAKNAGPIEDLQEQKTVVKEDMSKNAVREALLVEKK
jgi:hypothetical protein